MMSGSDSNSKETGRIEAFSDGVFAIAITLLILEIHVPEFTPDKSLIQSIMSEWPSILAFLIGFFTILICWINHHFMFNYIHKSDSLLMLVNGFKLLVVTTTPFATAVLAKSIDTSWEKSGVVLYCFNFALMGNAMTGIWQYASRKNFVSTPSKIYTKCTSRLFYLAAIFSTFIWAVSYVNVFLCLALSGVMFAIFLFPKQAVVWQINRSEKSIPAEIESAE